MLYVMPPLIEHNNSNKALVNPCSTVTDEVVPPPKSNANDESFPFQFWDCHDVVLPYNTSSEDKDDLSNASSSQYFQRSDFSPIQFTASYIPPMTLTVFLSGLALIVNPILFFAGALTLTTAKAYYNNDEICSGDGWLRETSKGNDGNESLTAVPLRVATCLEDDEEILIEGVTEETYSIVDPSFLEESYELDNFLIQFYPPLAEIAKENVGFTGLSASEFFTVFFANDAPFSFEELQKKRLDKDIVYGKWSLSKDKPSLHPLAPSVQVKSSLQERLLTFQTKTNSIFGPPYAKASKIQRVLVANKRLLVLEAITTLAEVPFCDRFRVMERWIVVAEKDFEGIYHSSLKIEFEVLWGKACPFESQIIASSERTFQEISTTWIQMAQQALEEAEQARHKRLLHTDIREEIELFRKKGKVVIVGDTQERKTRMSSFKKTLSKLGRRASLPR